MTMELPLTSSTTRANFLRFLSWKTGNSDMIIPKRVTYNYCLPQLKCSSRVLPPASRVYYSQTQRSKLLFSQPRKTIPLIKATNADHHQVGTDKFDSPLKKILESGDLLVRFIRPYIIYGTLVGFAGVITRTWMENAHLLKLSMWTLPIKALAVLVALICADGYITGINQIYDIEIDKINKPYLPIVSGELSLRSAWILVISYLAIGLAIAGVLKSGWLIAYILSDFVLGSLYSVPPFHTKRSTVGAVLTCASMRGYVFVLGLSAAARATLRLPFQLSSPVTFMATFATLFSLAIGVMKDLSDLEGDKQCNVPTLASIYGPRKIAFLGFGSMLLIYAGAIATSICMPQVFRRSVMIPAHIVLASCLILQAWKLEKANYSKEASQSFYQFMWKLLDAEFIIFPFI